MANEKCGVIWYPGNYNSGVVELYLISRGYFSDDHGRIATDPPAGGELNKAETTRWNVQ
ncbi:MAG TPA: hypothetical protein VJ937_10755 [Salinivirga sp.]|uniref:hypothetical protein n=1 Tax=Salinivirga sp. TaxID=1970192 RepID=UPI002B49169D|nr:hypothetical protein [Salinivirga sp.]HKK59949.1 hypothetical protein [Salinivirga sp.]